MSDHAGGRYGQGEVIKYGKVVIGEGAFRLVLHVGRLRALAFKVISILLESARLAA